MTSHVFRALIISYAVAHASAFQPDFLARAIQEAAQSVASGGANLDPSALITTAASAAVGAAPTSVDEMLFVAANLLDSSRRVGSKRSNSKLQYPELLNDAPNAIRYDYGAQLSRTISLSASEREVFDLLMAARNRYCPSTTIRVAGGWVRDKLLQQSNAPCRDIDLVLSDVSGIQFVDMLRQYLNDENLLNMLQTNGGGGDIGGEDATNQKQQGKSRKGLKADHLQTASLCINGFDLDFVRLRNEKYGDERIPEKVDVGSIVEDAWRRDLTINALYYNINTNQVEDWTEQGLQDLQLRNIATTRPPLKTLLEDPTRLLRAIRFAAQLGWTVDPRLFRAASDLRVRYALQTKVSRDAIGKGIDACFATRDPSRAIKLLLATNLIDVTFPLGDYKVSPQVQISIFLSGLDALCRVQTLASRIFTDENEWDETRRRHLFYASFLKPLYSDNVLPSRSNKRKTPFSRLLSEGVKLSKSDIKSIEVVLRGSLDLQNLVTVDNMDASCLTDQERQSLRWLFWQALCPLGHIWREALLLSLSSLPIPLSVAVNQYSRLIDVINGELNLDLILLDGQYKMEPILTGAQIREQALPAIRGEAFQEVLLAQEEWQVRNEIYRPGGSPRDGDGSSTFDIAIESQLIDHLQSKFPAYCIDSHLGGRGCDLEGRKEIV